MFERDFVTLSYHCAKVTVRMFQSTISNMPSFCTKKLAIWHMYTMHDVYNKEQGFHSDLVTASCVIRCWLSTRRNVCFSVFQIGNNLERVNIEKWWNYVFSYNAITILAYEVNIPSEKQVFPHRFALTDTIMNALC